MVFILSPIFISFFTKQSPKGLPLTRFFETFLMHMYYSIKQKIHNYVGWGKVELKLGKVVDWHLLEL